MSIDFAHDCKQYLCLDADITTDTTTAGTIIDTQDLLPNLAFYLALTTCTSGTFTLVLQDGDESDLSDAATITSIVFADAADLDSEMSDGDELAQQGVFDTKRYVRASVTSADVSGTGHVVVTCLGELATKPNTQA